MKGKNYYIFTIGLSLLLILSSYQVFGQELTGEEIIEKTQTVESLKDIRGVIEMKIIHKTGKERIMELNVIGLEAEDGIEKSLIRFTKPTKIKGTGFLSISDPNGPDESYLYLPALGKPRRISSEERGGNFMGSDFTYEDMAPSHEDYEHKLVRTEEIDGKEYYIIESVPKTNEIRRDVGFAKKITWIEKDRFIVLKSEYLDINGNLIRVLEMSDYQQVGEDAWIPIKMEMKTIDKDSRTTLEYKNLEVNTGLSDEDFTIRQLTRPI